MMSSVEKLKGRAIGLGVAASMLAVGLAVIRADTRSDQRHRELVDALSTVRVDTAGPAPLTEPAQIVDTKYDRRRAFWREVMGQVIGSLIAAGVVAIVFILTGGFTEKVKYYIGFTLALLVLFTIIGGFAVQLAMPLHGRPLTNRNLTGRIILALVILIIGSFETRGVIAQVGKVVSEWANYAP